jgi:hypothetical protein
MITDMGNSGSSVVFRSVVLNHDNTVTLKDPDAEREESDLFLIQGNPEDLIRENVANGAKGTAGGSLDNIEKRKLMTETKAELRPIINQLCEA